MAEKILKGENIIDLISKNEGPDYKRIYRDLIAIEFPDKINDTKFFFSKCGNWSNSDVLKFHRFLYNTKEGYVTDNNKHKSYDKETIIEILEYQRKNNLNNLETSKHFGVSRNSITKWRKIFLSK